MSNKQFNLTVQTEGTYNGRRNWRGVEMHGAWSVDNVDDNQRGEWTTSTAAGFAGWLQFRGLLNNYCMRYNAHDLTLEDTDLETVFSPGSASQNEMGVMFNYKNKNSFYFVSYNGGFFNWGGKNLRLYKKSGSVYRVLAEVAMPVFDRTKKYKMNIRSSKGAIKVWLDDAVVFDVVDTSSPLTSGAFGPITKGQDFARWEYIRAISNSSFFTSKKVDGIAVESVHKSPETAKRISPQTVGEFMEGEIQIGLAGLDYTSYRITRFIISSSNSAIPVLFDKTPGVRFTSNPDAVIYAYAQPPSKPPVKIVGLVGQTVSEESIKLTWSHDGVDTDGYYILNGEAQIVGTVSSSAREYIETGLEEYKAYSRYVVPYNVAGVADLSNLVIVTTMARFPSTPGSFYGVALDDNRIEWTWDDSSYNEESFEIVDFSDGVIRVVGIVEANKKSFIETGLLPETTYYRYVRSKNTRGTSELSEEAWATTLELLPPPPRYAPSNFKGVGVAHDIIMWAWIDRNTDADGFVFYDKQGKELFRTPYMTIFNETNLMSEMEYGRSIAAYNRGGVGPKTEIVFASTLPYGYDRQNIPVAPFNLTAFDITDSTAALTWDYEESPLLPHDGFIVYGENDVPLIRVEQEDLTGLLTGLEPGRYYRVYVIAYNDNGESMKSNVVSFSTLSLSIESDGHTNEIKDGFVDNLDGVEYDFEDESTPPIKAFASGVGDRFDLLVESKDELYEPVEELSFISRIRGLYEEEEIDYPVVNANVQLSLTTRDATNTVINAKGEKIKVSLRAGDNPEKFTGVLSIDGLPKNLAPLASDYKLNVTDENGVTIRRSGDSNIFYIMDVEAVESSVGFVENVEMSNVYGSWHKFSHNGSSQLSGASASSIWEYDALAGAIKTTENIERFTGTVSPDSYDNYDFKAQLYSTKNDNDCMGLILAYAVDEFGIEHTLSAIRRRDRDDIWAVWYNFEKTGAMRVAEFGGFDTHGSGDNWSAFGTIGTIIHAKRAGDSFEVRTTKAGQINILASTRLAFTLNDHPKLEIFKGAKPIGIGAKSQADTYLKITAFEGEKVEIKHFIHVHLWTDKVDTRIVHREWMGRDEVNKGYMIRGVESQEIVVKIQSPYFQAEWQALNATRKFVENGYSISISTLNPNVYMEFIDVPDNFSPTGNVYLNFRVSAKIINIEQTPWHPQIHNGYYYLNQQEHFLYSETDVRAELGSDVRVLEYTFPYDINLELSTDHDGGEVYVNHKTSADFLKGAFGPDLVIPLVDNYMTMTLGDVSAVYESPILTYIDNIVDWSTSHVVGRNPEQVGIEVAELDSFDNVTAWHDISVAPPIKRTKYRLTLNPVRVPIYDKISQVLSTDALENSYLTYIDTTGSEIRIKNPEVNPAGTIVTRPFAYGAKVHTLDEITMQVDIPEGGAIQVYTVTAESFTHAFHLPTAENPWIPANLISKVGNVYKFKPTSVPNDYVSVVVEIVRGNEKATPVIRSMMLDATTETMVVQVPLIEQINVGGKMNKGATITKYTIPMVGKLISDMSWQPLTEYSVSETVSRYMKEKGMVLSEKTMVKEYIYSIDPMLPIELDGDYLGINVLLGKTTDEVGDAAYRQKDIIIEDDKAIVRPIPQSGKPIIVRNAQGTLMRHVHNLDEEFKPTLDFTEFLTTTSSRYLFLRNLHHHIDLRSVHILIYLDGRWIRIYNAVLKQNRIILPISYGAGHTVKVIYRIHNSYTIDYNHDTEKDYALINVHMDYNEDITESKVLKVIYETNKLHSYYIAEEVNMNPLQNKDSKGFLYLTNEVKQAEKLDIYVVENVTSTNHEEVIVHAYLYDEDENPVVNQTVTMEADYGTLLMKTMETDENGMVVYKLNVSGVLRDKVTLTATALITSHKTLYAKKEVSVHRESFGSKIVLEAMQREFDMTVGTLIEVLTVGENSERVSGVTLDLTATHGHVSPSTIITDHEGKYTVTYHHNGNLNDKIICITAENNANKESIILGMKEV